MSTRYRLTPTPQQEAAMRKHCAHARYVWNLCVEQNSWYRRGRGRTPTWVDQCRQLTEARAEFEWLRDGCCEAQRQAIRDFDQAMKNFFGGTHRPPTWRKAGLNEGFRIADRHGAASVSVRRLTRRVGEIRIPKVGWVRFRWSSAVSEEAKSYRVTLDHSGRWHVAFAVIPAPIAAPCAGEVVGIDRGVSVSAALSTGEMSSAPGLRDTERARLLRLERKSARQRVRGRPASNRLRRTYLAIAKIKARETDRRKDWAEKLSTDIARRFDVIRVEDLKIQGMTRSARGTVEIPGRNVRQKAGLNRAILENGWGLLGRRLEQKAPGRVEKVSPHFTSQTCNACGHCEAGNRKSQAVFLCLACGHADHADVNAAKNIAAGHAVTARGGFGKLSGPVNREPLVGAARAAHPGISRLCAEVDAKVAAQLRTKESHDDHA